MGGANPSTWSPCWLFATGVSSADDKSRAVLVFEVDHVQRVLAARLDAADAQSTIERWCRQRGER